MSMWRAIINKSKNSNTPASHPRPGQKMPLAPNQIMERLKDEVLTGSVEDVMAFMKEILKEKNDFIVREFDVFGRYKAALFYFFSMVDKAELNEDILIPLMQTREPGNGPLMQSGEREPADGPLQSQEGGPDQNGNMQWLARLIKRQTLSFTPVETTEHLVDLVDAVTKGISVVVVEGLTEAFMIGCRRIDKRAIEQPPTEQVIQGPREGFIEHLDTNLGLIRYRLQTPDMQVNLMTVGRVTKTKVAICYLEGIANPELVKEVKDRLNKIDFDAVLDAGYLEQFIEDNYLSPFPQVLNTEKPDKVVANLLEGRVSIHLDGTPFALVVPAVFNQFYQVTEDYAARFLQGSFIRLVRVIALVFSLIFPSLYVAIISFNPELIPTEFAVAVAGGRAGVAFPSIIEVIIIEVSMEVLREATVRLPQQVGGALSIVGVLVVGQAAVAAGFASPITVVVIALTTIGSFATPAYNSAFALRMLRFPLIILAGMFGLYGVMIGLILIGNHMLSLKSFGVPYLSPAVPLDMQGLKDLIVRAPLWSMLKRPAVLDTPNETRLGPNSKPTQSNQTNVMDPTRRLNANTGDDQDGASSNIDAGGGDSG